MQQPEMSIGLALVARRESQGEEESKFDDVKALQEEPLQVKFLLPDDSALTHEFKKGHTVMVLKGFLEAELELPPQTTQLYLASALMLDPLSLTDFKAVLTARSLEIEVRQLVRDADGMASGSSGWRK